MEKKFDPRGKERKRTNRKKWYKAVCSLAAAVVVCTVYTLMLPALTLDEESAGDAGVTISESSVPTSEAPAAAEISKSDNGSESHNDTAADSSADSSHAATESGPAAAAPSDDRAPSTTNPTTEGEHNAPVTLPTEETNSGAITGSSESHDEVTSPDTDDQEKIKDEENNGSPAADEEEVDNSGSSSDADTEEDDSEKSDDTADVETANDWETTIPDLSDCETWAEKLLAVAGSQLGYHESILNFRVDSDGEHKGYTRYGEWYGNPYGDWCAMFVSFCLKYAGIDEEAIPQNANCSDWVTNLKKMEIYEDADLYVPEAGDIVFFDQSDADRPNHVGIISEVTYGTKTVIRHITKDGSAIESGAMNALKYINEATSDDASGDELRTEEVEVPIAESIKVIEGNSSDQVQYVDYDLSNEKILGYISLTNAKNVYEGVEEKKPVEEQKPEENKIVKEQEVSGYNITVDYGSEANIPETASLVVKELSSEDEAYATNYEQMVNALVMNAGVEDESELNISAAKLFDISFMDGETEIEPAAKVNVSIKCNKNADLAVAEDQTLNAVHVTNDGVVEILDVDTETDKEYNVQALSFEQASFSVTGVIVTSSDAEYIRAVKNASFTNGEAYIIYSDNNALSYNNGLLTNKSIKNDDEVANNYIKIKKSDTTVWHNENGKIYTVSENSKKYLKINNKIYTSLSITDKASDATSWEYNINSKQLSYGNGRKTYYLSCQQSDWNITTNTSNVNVSLAKIEEIGIFTDRYKVSINDTITNDGCLRPSISINNYDMDTGINYEEISSDFTYKWVKSRDGGKTFKEVIQQRVSGDYTNVADDGSWINAVFDNGTMDDINSIPVQYKAVLYKDGKPVYSEVNSNQVIESEPFSVEYYNQLQNGSFENPEIEDNDGNGGFQYQPVNGTNGLVWKTTASDQKVELVSVDPNKKGKDGRYMYKTYAELAKKYHGLGTATDGVQYAEINAEQAGALYQDVVTKPGSTMHWSVDHAGRDGTDTMAVVIMNANDAVNITTQSQLLDAIKKIGRGKYPGAIVANNLKANKAIWTTHSGTYKVPDGQYYTRYFFVAIDTGSTASNKDTIGNHIDNVYFGVDLPEPNPGKTRVILKKNIYGLTDDAFENGILVSDTKMSFSIIVKNGQGEIKVKKEISPFKNEECVWSKNIDAESGIPYYTLLMSTDLIDIPANDNGSYTYEVVESGYDELNGYTYVKTVVEKPDSEKNENIYKTTGKLYEKQNCNITFTNIYTPMGVELPETGGPGTTLLYLLGAMLITAPLTITFIKRRRQEEEEN